MDKTVETLLTEIQIAVNEAAGVSVQVYSETTLINLICDAFTTVSSDPDKDWKRFNSYQNYTLDGTTGRTTVLIKNTFKDFLDIRYIFQANTDRKLVSVDINTNPSRFAGTTPLGFIGDTVDILKITPATAVGDITITGKIFPTLPFLLTDVVPFDYLCIKHLVCWMYMTNEGTNPGAAAMFQQLFESRYKHLSKLNDQQPIALNGRGGQDFPTEWYVR